MKLKLDENIPQSAAPRLAAVGYDIDTMLDERLGGRSDEDVFILCCAGAIQPMYHAIAQQILVSLAA